MQTLTLVAAAGALTLACAGCSGSMSAATNPGPPTTPPHLVSTTASLHDSVVIVDIRTDHPLFDFRGHDLQVFVDTDESVATGYGAHGDEYVARLVELHDSSRFPVRRTEPADPADPAGWGEISGRGLVGYGSDGLRLSIPLSSLGDDDGRMRLRIELYSGGAFDYRDATTDAPLLAAH
jgi:hypothetical protein